MLMEGKDMQFCAREGRIFFWCFSYRISGFVPVHTSFGRKMLLRCPDLLMPAAALRSWLDSIWPEVPAALRAVQALREAADERLPSLHSHHRGAGLPRTAPRIQLFAEKTTSWTRDMLANASIATPGECVTSRLEYLRIGV